MADMQEKYESEKKALEITGLKADKLSAALDQGSSCSAHGTSTCSLPLWCWASPVPVGPFAHHLARTQAIQKEKDVSESLPLNILPEEVAAGLKLNGADEARLVPSGHGSLAPTLQGLHSPQRTATPIEFGGEIDHCFKAFDGIVDARRIEKIKTIGDAYMAAGGLPDPAYGGPAEVVLAALELQDFMTAYATQRRSEGRPFFEMRVGVHTGPVIAGIVGVKKFAYDIWGDTVNTASRMESSGAVGCVNVSGATHALLQNDPRFRFEARGMVAAKGKGDMQMYFAYATTDSGSTRS
ncbi:MAG: hypothetical protein IPN85_15105 [Flavobacteriales bacterium]|nr:hypothetical protein [Flavobacteriales bacterium]